MTRPIDQRFKPPVAGIDLEHSLNYIDLEDAGEAFIYERYTGTRLPYRKGSRPMLEELAARATAGATTPLDQARAIAAHVATEYRWAGYYEKKTGRPLPKDRGLTEEAIIESGYGWCNEQARVLCGLTQVIGVPSRLVFAGNPDKKYGHVETEVYLPEGWMLIDQSFGYCFLMEGMPIRAADIKTNPGAYEYADRVYQDLAKVLIDDLGREILADSFDMMLDDHPVKGFKALGFHNYFVH